MEMNRRAFLATLAAPLVAKILPPGPAFAPPAPEEAFVSSAVSYFTPRYFTRMVIGTPYDLAGVTDADINRVCAKLSGRLRAEEEAFVAIVFGKPPAAHPPAPAPAPK